MPHVWKNADFSGTCGWFRCERCGCCEWVVQAEGAQPSDLIPPAADKKLSWPLKTCEELIEAEAEAIVDKVRRTIDKAGTHRPSGKPAPAVRQAATQKLKGFIAGN